MTAPKMNKRFRGFLPVVIDIETGGVNPATDAVFEVAAVFVNMKEDGTLYPGESVSSHVNAFEGANIDRKALEFTGIIPDHPFRFAIDEAECLDKLFTAVNEMLKTSECQRAVLVGHNAWFDLHFLQAMIRRVKCTNPFHKFTCFDTATLSGLAFGQTVLARACRCAKIDFDTKEAHNALYDATRTAELFCYIVNNTPLINNK